MQLRPHPNGHQNVILCFLGCAPGTFLQVNQRNTEAYLHDKYPGVNSIIYLPSSFSTIVKYLKVKNNMSGYSHYHFLLNQQLTWYFTNISSEHYDYLQTQLFLTEVAAVDFCVNLVIDNYVQMTSEMFTNRGEQTSYLRKAGRANKRWIDHR